MTQVVTISATTAGYAAEPLRASARVSGASPVEATVRALSEKAMQTGDIQQKMLMNVVRPPALALFFLTANQQHPQPQTTREHAEEQYRANATEESDISTAADEAIVPHADQAPNTETITADALDRV
jgi:hypothetical protein